MPRRSKRIAAMRLASTSTARPAPHKHAKASGKKRGSSLSLEPSTGPNACPNCEDHKRKLDEISNQIAEIVNLLKERHPGVYFPQVKTSDESELETRPSTPKSKKARTTPPTGTPKHIKPKAKSPATPPSKSANVKPQISPGKSTRSLITETTISTSSLASTDHLSKKYCQNDETSSTNTFLAQVCRAVEAARYQNSRSMLRNSYPRIVTTLNTDFRWLFCVFNVQNPKPIRFEFVPASEDADEDGAYPTVRIFGDYNARRAIYLRGELVRASVYNKCMYRTCIEPEIPLHETHFIYTLDSPMARRKLQVYITNLFLFSQYIVLTNENLMHFLKYPELSPPVNKDVWTVPDVTFTHSAILKLTREASVNAFPGVQQYIKARYSVAMYLFHRTFSKEGVSPIFHAEVSENLEELYKRENRPFLLHKSPFNNLRNSPNLCHSNLNLFWPYNNEYSGNSESDESDRFLTVPPPGSPIEK